MLKLNLSPIAFREDDGNLWNADIIEETEYKTQDDFIKDLNNLNRFKSITNEYKPKLIICTGITHKENFVKSFFG